MDYHSHFKKLNFKDFNTCICNEKTNKPNNIGYQYQYYTCKFCRAYYYFYNDLLKTLYFNAPFHVGLPNECFQVSISINNDNFAFHEKYVKLPFSMINLIVKHHQNKSLNHYINKHIDVWKILL